MNDKIDIVIPWVDGSDPNWLKEKEKYSIGFKTEQKSFSNIRFESWDNLHYWFRAVEKFMPWINNIFFITWGHIPEFLNVNHSRLRVIKHEDYIPVQYLPTFNSNTIEMNLHRIPELSENFILFNDDTFPLQLIEKEYYYKNGLICDEAVEGLITPVEVGAIGNMARYVQVNNMIIINRNFKKRDVQKKNWDKWFNEGYGDLLERTNSLDYWYDFTGFHDPHMANILKKSVMEKLWRIEYYALDLASGNKFRAYTDVSQYLVRYWQLCEGYFNPRRTLGKFYQIDNENCETIAKDIEELKYQMVSINENCSLNDFAFIKNRINQGFRKILLEKSQFEI